MEQGKVKELERLLSGHKSADVENYVNYCIKSATDKNKYGDKKGELKNKWFHYVTAKMLSDYFIKVHNEGLVLDGRHITIQSTGLSYDYIAYKNKMLIVYPETLIDLQLVYKGDTFTTSKESGKVNYVHTIANPFNQKDSDIIGGYCVVKNKRGEFLTTMSPADIDKHRKIARTDTFWKKWFKEMCLKTIIKKAMRIHFEDVYQAMNDEDNKQVDLDKQIEETKQEFTAEVQRQISECNSVEEYTAVYNNASNSLKVNPLFTQAISTRRRELSLKKAS